MSTTPNNNLPFATEGNINPAADLNNTLKYIDALVQLEVLAITATPPTGMADGARYAIADGATGAWAGKDGMVAEWFNAAWFYVPAKFAMYNGAFYRSDDGDWNPMVTDANVLSEQSGSTFVVDPKIYGFYSVKPSGSFSLSVLPMSSGNARRVIIKIDTSLLSPTLSSVTWNWNGSDVLYSGGDAPFNALNSDYSMLVTLDVVAEATDTVIYSHAVLESL